MIMNDIDRMNAFLNLIKNAALAGRKIDYNLVYGTLIRFGRRVVNDEKINTYFIDFMKCFADVDDLHVYIEKDNPYFCHFQNGRDKVDVLKMLKMYVPIDDAHIKEAVKRIFTFMAKERMIHSSKVSSILRIDDVVIRVINKEDLEKVRNFIANDKYICEGLMSHNPFLPTDGMMSYAWDGFESLNCTLVSYIVMYINSLAKYNMLDSVSYHDFYIFIANTYKDVFENGLGMIEYLMTMTTDNKHPATAKDLATFEGITKMLLLTMDPKCRSYQSFMSAYDFISSSSRMHDMDIKLQEMYSLAKPMNSGNISMGSIDIDLAIEKYKPFWLSIYPPMVRQYGYENADMRFLSFLETENYDYLPRKYNVRTMVMQSNINSEFMKMLFIKMKKKQANYLLFASLETIYKYNYHQLFEALQDGQKGDFIKFTSANNGRKNLQNNIKPGELMGVMISTLLERGYKLSLISHDLEKLIDTYIQGITNYKKHERTH